MPLKDKIFYLFMPGVLTHRCDECDLEWTDEIRVPENIPREICAKCDVPARLVSEIKHPEWLNAPVGVNVTRHIVAPKPHPGSKSQKRMTIAERKFASALFETGDMKKAGEAIGVGPIKAGRVMERLMDNDAFKVLVEKSGVSDLRLIKTIKHALRAKVVATYRGEATVSEAPDYDVRLKAAEMGLKIKGRLSEDEGPKISNSKVVIVYGNSQSETSPLRAPLSPSESDSLEQSKV
jgi:hypothetical protein